MITNIQNFIEILKKYPFNTKRQMALNLLERYLKHIKGEIIFTFTKDELENIVDVVKEIKQEKALSYDEYNQLEKDAKAIKRFIEWGYKEQRLANPKETSKNDL